jgi:uncharacterized membrane-anchored protein YhcB (DUF1043 family)
LGAAVAAWAAAGLGVVVGVAVGAAHPDSTAAAAADVAA